jgi:hypothetical protein
MTGGTTSNLLDAAAISQGVVKRGTQGIRDQPECIEEVALPGTVRPDQECQAAEADVAGSDALIVLEDYTGQKRRVSHITRLSTLCLFAAEPPSASI